MNDNSQASPQGLQMLQTSFMDYLLHEQDAIVSHIDSTASLSSDVRLAIYGNGYFARLIEVLEKDFTALFAVLGEEAFSRLAVAYINAHPSTNPSLRLFGQHMTDFLEQHAGLDNRDYLVELARLEWCFTDAFDAADVPVATEVDAASVPPEEWPVLSMIFHPSIQLFDYRWNILPTWQALREEEPLPAPQQLPAQYTGLVWREELMTRYRTLEPDEAAVLPVVMQGGNFSDLCEVLVPWCEDVDAIPMQAATLLKTWLNSGMVSELQF